MGTLAVFKDRRLQGRNCERVPRSVPRDYTRESRRDRTRPHLPQVEPLAMDSGKCLGDETNFRGFLLSEKARSCKQQDEKELSYGGVRYHQISSALSQRKLFTDNLRPISRFDDSVRESRSVSGFSEGFTKSAPRSTVASHHARAVTFPLLSLDSPYPRMTKESERAERKRRDGRKNVSLFHDTRNSLA